MEFILKKCSLSKLHFIKKKSYSILNLYNRRRLASTSNILNLSKKIISISGIYLFFKYFINSKNKLKCYSYPQLINYIDYKQDFSLKKGPKIIYMKKPSTGSSDEDAKSILDNFERIYSKYPDIQSYVIDIKNTTTIKELKDLLENYGTSLEDFLGNDEGHEVDYEKNFFEIRDKLTTSKPFIFLNKYGDVRNYSVNEFNNISNDESVFTYFEKLTIMNNKNDLLMLNEYDFILFHYIDNSTKSSVDYKENNFRMFRKAYFNLNFFNIKYFVATPELSPFLNLTKDDLNKMFLIKRKNKLTQVSLDCTKVIELDGELFEIKELQNVNVKSLNNESIILI